MKPAAIIVIGASAGGVEALTSMLPALPGQLNAAVAVVVHMGPQDPGLLPALFSPRCRLKVKEAQDKEPLAAGTIYFAPVDYHLLIETDMTFSLSCDDPVNYSRPSIDILFESAGAAESCRVLAIVLSGANADGASGACSIASHGGTVFVQSPESAVCDVMPNAAIGQCPGAVVVPLDQVANHAVQWVAQNGGARC